MLIGTVLLVGFTFSLFSTCLNLFVISPPTLISLNKADLLSSASPAGASSKGGGGNNRGGGMLKSGGGNPLKFDYCCVYGTFPLRMSIAF
jgi:hypothetical protein